MDGCLMAALVIHRAKISRSSDMESWLSDLV
jgi:hypothetical protein